MGFIAKIYLFNAALSNGLAWLAIVAAINSALALYYYLRVIARIYLSLSKGTLRKIAQPWLDAAIVMTAVLTVGFGILPFWLANFTEAAAIWIR